jgi:hypothetical protein
MKTIYYTAEDLKARILEVRELRELSLEREAELLLLYEAIAGKENCVIDQKGQILALGEKKETYYNLDKKREDRLHTYRQRLQGKHAWKNG